MGRKTLDVLRDLIACRRANIATMAALMAPVGIALAALAVDEASLYVERREAQSITDLAAIAGAQDLPNAERTARQTLAANGLVIDGEQRGLVVAKGHYSADPAVPPSQRFMADANPANAVRVDFEKTGRLYFAQGFFESPKISTSAIATREATVAFSIGSRLAKLDGGIVNTLLGGLTGSQISLSAMDYDSLLSTDVDLLSFFKGLATSLDLKGATYDQLLASEVSMSELAAAIAASEGVVGRAVSAAGALANWTDRPSAARFPLSRIFGLNLAGGQPVGTGLGGLEARTNALQLITAAAAVAGGGNQVDLDLGATVPGLLGATLDLAIGEPPQNSPWFTIGHGGEIVRTAQTRLRLVVQVGGGGQLGSIVRIPLYLDLAYAEARLASVTCPTGREDSVDVVLDVRPGVADLRLADMDASRLDDFRNPIPLNPATLVSLPLVKVSGTAHAQIGNQNETSVHFDRADIDDGTVKTVATRDFTQSLFASLLGDLDVSLKVAGIKLNLDSLLGKTLQGTLQAAAPAIDGLLGNVLATLGLSLGEADVRVTGASCGRAVLVQ